MTAPLDMIRGRSNIVTLTNNSGGALVAGDVCVQDTTGDEYATTTTSAASVLKIFVAAESIASAATGKFYESGYCPLVNVNASVTRGRFLFTHTVAKQAAENATYGTGAFGKILKSGTTPSAIIYSATAQVGSSGAPTDAEYVTTAANGSLSAEVSIPGLAGSADIAGIGGGGITEEYDTATTGLTWDSAPSVENSDTTVKSHLYVEVTEGTFIGTRDWSPGSGAFDARTKMGIASGQSGNYGSTAMLYISTSDGATAATLEFALNESTARLGTITAYTFATPTFTKRGNSWTPGPNVVYLRITRDGSNNLSFYWSSDGFTWVFIATQALTFTVAKIGYRVFLTASGTKTTMTSDWLRTNV